MLAISHVVDHMAHSKGYNQQPTHYLYTVLLFAPKARLSDLESPCDPRIRLDWLRCLSASLHFDRREWYAYRE